MPQSVILADEFTLPEEAAKPTGVPDLSAEFELPEAEQKSRVGELVPGRVRPDFIPQQSDYAAREAAARARGVVKTSADQPMIELPQLPEIKGTADQPLTGIEKVGSAAAGVYNEGARLVSSFTSPANVAILLTTGGLANAAKAGSIAARRALVGVGAYFAGTMGKDAIEQIPEAKKTFDDPNASPQEKAAAITAPVLTAGMSVLAALGAVHEVRPDLARVLRDKSPREAATRLNEEAATSTVPEQKAVLQEAAAQIEQGEAKVAQESAPVLADEFSPPAPGPEAAKLTETPSGAQKLSDIQEALKSPDTVIQYSVWDKEMLPPGMDRVAQVDLINEKTAGNERGGIASTSRALINELGIDAPPAPESLPPGRYTLEQIREAIAKEANPNDVISEFEVPEGLNPESPVVGLGAAAPAEFRPVESFVTSIKNSVVDQEMKSRGETPLMAEAAKDFGSTWNDAMKRIDEDQNVADSLITELKDKIRPATNVENAILLHRKIELENAFNKSARNIRENIGTPDSLAADRVAKQQALDDLLELNKISRSTGSEQSAALNTRKLMAAQDYSLTSMLEKRSTAKGDVRLTPEEISEVEAQNQKIVDAERATSESKTQDERNINEAKADKAKSEFDDLLESDKYDQLTGIQKLRQQTVSAYDAARNLMTTGEFSFVLRQGKIAAASHPIMTARALPKAFQALFADEVTARAIDIQTKNDPMAAKAIQNGVHFAEDGAKLSAREETLASKLADKIPLLRNFNQAGRVFLNKLRMDLYKTMAGDRQLSPEQGEALAKYVNEATGRGSLGGLEKSSVALGRILFAPRYLSSRIQYLTGHSMWGGDLTTRRIIAKEYAKTLVGLGVYYASLNAAFDALNDDPKKKPVVTMDPRSTDFGKVRIGETRIDPLAGLSQVIVLGARTASGETTTAAGKVLPIRGAKVPPSRRWSTVATRFARSKLHPLPGSIWNLFDGTDLANKEATLETEAENLVTPLTYVDIYEALEEQDLPAGVAASLLAILGEGLQTYAPKPKKQMGVAAPSEPAKQKVTLPSGKKVNVRPAK